MSGKAVTICNNVYFKRKNELSDLKGSLCTWIKWERHLKSEVPKIIPVLSLLLFQNRSDVINSYNQGRSHEFLGGQVELLQSKADLMNAHA